MHTQTILTDFIVKELAVGRSKPIQPDENLFSTGVFDSIKIMQVVLFLEEHLGIKVPDEDVSLENFQSVSAIIGYLERRKAGGA